MCLYLIYFISKIPSKHVASNGKFYSVLFMVFCFAWYSIVYMYHFSLSIYLFTNYIFQMPCINCTIKYVSLSNLFHQQNTLKACCFKRQILFFFVYGILFCLVFHWIHVPLFFIYLPVDGHLGCIQFFTIINNTAMNIWMYVSFLNRALPFYGYITRSRTDQSYGNLIVRF